jgi:hypothetical protein
MAKQVIYRDSWVAEYSDRLTDDQKFDIKALRYLEKITPTKISKALHIPLQVINYICDLEKKQILEDLKAEEKEEQ